MKKLITFALVGAAVAGAVYLLRDNETVKGLIGKAKDAANDALDKARNGYEDVVRRASEPVSEIA